MSPEDKWSWLPVCMLLISSQSHNFISRPGEYEPLNVFYDSAGFLSLRIFDGRELWQKVCLYRTCFQLRVCIKAASNGRVILSLATMLKLNVSLDEAISSPLLWRNKDVLYCFRHFECWHRGVINGVMIIDLLSIMTFLCCKKLELLKLTSTPLIVFSPD